MSLPDSSERAQQLGWSHETRPDIGKLDPDLAGRFGFGQVRRVGALPAYRSDGATVVWVRPGLDWSALLETQSEFDAGFTPVVIPEDMFNLAMQRAFERSGAAADAVAGPGPGHRPGVPVNGPAADLGPARQPGRCADHTPAELGADPGHRGGRFRCSHRAF